MCSRLDRCNDLYLTPPASRTMVSCTATSSGRSACIVATPLIFLTTGHQTADIALVCLTSSTIAMPLGKWRWFAELDFPVARLLSSGYSAMPSYRITAIPHRPFVISSIPPTSHTIKSDSASLRHLQSAPSDRITLLALGNQARYLVQQYAIQCIADDLSGEINVPLIVQTLAAECDFIFGG